MLVCFYQVFSVCCALLEGPEDFLIQEGLEHKTIARTVLALHSRMATLLEMTTVKTPPKFSGQMPIVSRHQGQRDDQNFGDCSDPQTFLGMLN